MITDGHVLMQDRVRLDSEPFVLGPAERWRARAWLLRHLQTLLYSSGRLARSPVATALTVAVISVALALPAGLYLLLTNVERATRGWDVIGQVSLFMSPELTDIDAKNLAGNLEVRSEIADIRVITRGEALEEFRRISGFGDVLTALEDDNPLPAVLVLRLEEASSGPQAIAALVAELQARPDVDFAQYDLAWLERLHAILRLARTGVWLLAVLLALGVLLIVGNTLRLAVENRREEIEVSKLCGATDAFIRRPFLYSGMLQGLAGGLLALGLVQLAFAALEAPVASLAALYGSVFRLESLGLGKIGTLLGSAAALGWLGAWLSVGRHLRHIEPT